MKKYKIGITTGDLLGIGAEISSKALDILNVAQSDVLIIGQKISNIYDTIEIDKTNNGEFCYKSLEMAVKLAKSGEIGAIVTAPVSKEVLIEAGYNFSGQTEVLQKLFDKKAEMLFLAGNFRVMLLTRHLALKDIKLNEDEIIDKISRLNNFLISEQKIKAPKIAMCALNPHCGENGLIGREEIDIIIPALNELRNKGVDIENPKSADSLFAKIGKKYLNEENLGYDAIVACYHDQGLCPAKALAFDKIVNTSIGLDVIRTSPSSGVAYDIAGKNIADPSSMVEAIKLAFSLSKNSTNDVAQF